MALIFPFVSHPNWPPPTSQPLPRNREFLKSKGTYVLAPMIDSLNHKTTIKTDLDYDSIRQRFRLGVDIPFKKGEQVFMSYGPKSNDDLVLYYGFVESDNPSDIFEFGDMLQWLVEHRSNVVNDDRVQILFSKGLQDAVRYVYYILPLCGFRCLLLVIHDADLINPLMMPQ